MNNVNIMKRLPLISMQGMVVLPGMVGHIDLKAGEVEEALISIMNKGGEVALATMREGTEKVIDLSSLYPVGVLAEIKQEVKLPDGNIRILMEGKDRILLRDINTKNKGLHMVEAEIKPVEPAFYSADEAEVRIRMLSELLGEYVIYQPGLAKGLLALARNVRNVSIFLNAIMAKIPFQAGQRLSFLIQDREDLLFECVYREFKKELEIAKVRAELQDKLNREVSEAANTQKKEFFL